MRLCAILQHPTGKYKISLQAAEREPTHTYARGRPLEIQQALVGQLGNKREVDYTSMVEWIA